MTAHYAAPIKSNVNCIVKIKTNHTFLVTSSTHENTSQISQCADKRLQDIHSLKIFTDEVETLIKKLKVGKSSRHNNLPNRVLKEVAAELAPLVQSIFTQSLHTDKLPNLPKK